MAAERIDPKPAVPVAPRRTRVEKNIYQRADGRYEVGYRDSSSKQRWRVPDFPAAFDTITEARKARDVVIGLKQGGEQVKPSPKLKFGAAADRWLDEQVAGLRRPPGRPYRSVTVTTLNRAWGNRRLDSIDVDDAARLVRACAREG
jgi:hypothetical protein